MSWKYTWVIRSILLNHHVLYTFPLDTQNIKLGSIKYLQLLREIQECFLCLRWLKFQERYNHHV